MKDEQPVEFDERTQQIENLDGVCQLIINKPTFKDSGKYTCIATNNIGTSKISHQVEFVPLAATPNRRESGLSEKKDTTTTASESEAEKSDAKGGKEKAKGPRQRAAPKEAEQPSGGSRRAAPPSIEEMLKATRNKLSFVTHLTNRVYPVGTKIKLSCVVQGPDPNVRWLRDDQPLVYSPRVRNLSKDTLCILEISNCTVDDSGNYTLVVRNQDSDITCGCTLQVYDTKRSVDLAPTFTRALKGK